jgi:hypothetical protein
MVSKRNMYYPLSPRTVVGIGRQGTLSKTILLGGEVIEIGDLFGLLGYRALSARISPAVRDSLLGRRSPIVEAERTLKLALSALRRGDRRLAASRAITAIIQASTASVGATSDTLKRAWRVVFSARRLIHSIVIERAARLGLIYGGIQ